MKRWIVQAATLAVVAGACTSQAIPARSPLPPIPPYEPTEVFAPDPDALFPSDGTCAVASGNGALVTDILGGYPAEGTLELADRLTAVDGDRVGSAEALLATMAGRRPGDTVHLTVERRGQELEADLTLQAADGDPDRGLMGIVPASSYTVHQPPDLPLVDEPVGPQRHLFVQNDLYLLDPVSTEWQLFAADVDAPFATVAVGDEVYMLVDPAGANTIRALGSGAEFDIDARDWRFVRPLTALGNLILMSAVVAIDDDPSTVSEIGIVAVDVTTRDVAWQWTPGLSPNGIPVLPEIGFRSPSGILTVVTLAEVSRDPDVTPQRYHVLLDSAGTELSAFGNPDRTFIPDNSVLGGFFEDAIVLYTEPVPGGLSLSLIELREGMVQQLGVVPPDGSGRPPRFLAVGDGRHLLSISGAELSVVDPVRDLTGRPIIRGCEVRVGDYGFGMG